MPASPAPRSRPAPGGAGEVIRWAAFCCVLVPVVLVWHGISIAAAISAGLGLTCGTLACRAVLRHAERGAGTPGSREAERRGRNRGAGADAARGGNTPVD
ncbi:hypothetical protein AB0C59_13550 [Streptomyces sp. NPDC048664]|uniref:hypothetical protein n=1 Tax=Streptomyces sp. NPDC048664 TaxID=3154505 RepID=UPI00343E3E75